MMRMLRSAGWMLAALLGGYSGAQAATPDGYAYYETGDVSAKNPGHTDTGLMLMGGGDWDKRALRWFAEKAGHGHVVMLRASGAGEAGKEFFDDAGGLASVQTLVFDDRKAASDPKVLAIIAHADGIFLGGGDQSKYVRFWKDTPVAKALDAHVARGKPIGGTSAGLAILGGAAYGAMDGGSIDSMTALGDPMGPGVTIVRGFLHMPYLAHVVTDTHFTVRDRLGRLIAFVAQVRASGDPKAVGLGVDEGGALCVDARGIGTLFGPADDHAWLVEPTGKPTTAVAGKPLDWPAVRITGIGADSSIDLKTLKVTNAAFASTAGIKAGKLTGAPFPPGATWSLAIHGGAGVIPRGSLKPGQEAAYRKGLTDALAAGSAVLKSGGTSLDAVEAAIRVLEDDPLFNAGKGAVFDATGKNQLDAAIMDGATTKAGAVAGVTRTKNPISLARAVMEHSRHVLLAGPGADEFSIEQGLEQVDPGYFRTDQRWRDYLEWKRDNHASIDPTHRFGTVGAVARDMRGHLAAATSTGGLTGKKWGRIGDSPIIGAGTYAIDGDCAVSATGTGEYFIRESAGRQICDRIAWKGQTVKQAAGDTIEAIGDIGGDGGLIAMDGGGHVAFALNTEGMYRGTASSATQQQTGIYADESWILP